MFMKIVHIFPCSRKAEASVEVSAELQAKALRVKEELERIELKSSLLDRVSVLGKVCWNLI